MSKFQNTILLVIVFMCIYIAAPTLLGVQNSSSPVNLGLDLKGGVSMLLEVQADEYLQQNLDKAVNNAAQHSSSRAKNNRLYSNDVDMLYSSLQEHFKNRADILLTKEIDHVSINLTQYERNRVLSNLLDRTMSIFRKRIDESGTKEVEIYQQGENGISVNVPGIYELQDLREIIGKTAKLSFHMVNSNVLIDDALRGRLPADSMIVATPQGSYIVIFKRALLDGGMLVDAATKIQENRPVIGFEFNNESANIFALLTKDNVGKQLAIVLDGKAISAPTINSQIIGGQGVIQGGFSIEEANELALLLRSGALPADVKILSEQVVGATLGQDAIEASQFAAIVCLLMVAFLMVVFYGMLGVLSSIALVINLFVLVALLVLFEVTLTLPGIAGIILTLGMAIDANILIFERIKEIYNQPGGTTNVYHAIKQGFEEAKLTIFDANITTLFAGVALIIFGSGLVRGFGITLSIGIASSMFTAIFITKMLMMLWYRATQPKSIG